MMYWLCRFICFVFLKFYCGLKVRGAENIPRKGGFILAGNHVSYLDPIALGVACPRGLDYMARHDLFSNNLFSWVLYHIRAFPVRRGFADISALREAIRRLAGGSGLVIFPQGMRVASAADTRAEGGIGLLVRKLNVPVVPVFVKGSDIALPREAKFIRRSRIQVYFGKQIYLERRLSRQEIADEILRNIKDLSCLIPD